MNEKISDKPIREEKVKRVKAKILSEIAKELYAFKEEMKICLLDNDDDFNFLAKRIFVLLNLKEYIEDDYSFMAYTYKNPAMDIIIYYVSDECLSIWLQDNYSFVFNFLRQAEKCEYDVFSLLNEDYFGYNFTSIMDIVIYNEKIKEQKEVNMDG